MTISPANQPAHQGKRLLVRHFFWIVAAFALCVSIFAIIQKPLAGIAALCTFIGLLLPAWQLSIKSNVYAGSFKNLPAAEKASLVFALIGVLLTALGYYVGLKSLFASC